MTKLPGGGGGGGVADLGKGVWQGMGGVAQCWPSLGKGCGSATCQTTRWLLSPFAGEAPASSASADRSASSLTGEPLGSPATVANSMYN